MTRNPTFAARFLLTSALITGPAAFGQLLFAPAEPSTTAPEVLFRVDIKTVTERGADAGTSPLAPRLFLDAAHETPAPLGTTVWFVADLEGNGLPFLASGLREVPLSQMLGADDTVLYRDVVDGDQPGAAREGVYRRLGLPVTWEPDDAARIKNAPIFMILWNATGENYQPAAGAKFGLYDVGVRPPPEQLGNAFWSIHGDVGAAAYDVVPEPAAWSAAGAGLALLGARLLRRRGVRH